MKKSKIILKYSYIIIILFTFFYVKNYIKNNRFNSKYQIDNTHIEGYIKDIKKDDNKLSIIINDILVNFYNEDIPSNLEVGDYLKVDGKLVIPNDNTTPNLFNYKKYLYSKNIHYILKPNNYEKINKNIPIIYYIKRKMIKYFSRFKSNNYLLTFILGCNYEIDKEVLSSYNKNGVSHLFALSGMHVSMLTCIILFILTKMIKEKKAYLICSLFLVFYLFLTGFSKSIVRASFLFFFLTFKKIFKVKIDIKKMYIIFTCFMLIINPYNIYNNAFLFSYIISFCLICFGQIVNNYNNYFIKVFVTSLISFLVGLPISINASFELNLLSPFFNIFFVPIISLIIFPLTLLTAIIPILDNLTFNLMSLVEKVSLLCSQISQFKIIMPYMNIKTMIIYYLTFVFIMFKIRIKKYRYLLFLIILLFIHYNTNYLRNYSSITVLDIGQGDSILINFKNNKGVFLIDIGGKYGSTFSYALNTTIPYLKSLGIHKIDYLILTHGDYDHMGEAFNLLDNFTIKNVIMNSGNNNFLEKKLINLLDIKKIPYQQVSEFSLNYKGYIFNFINNKNLKNENEDSLVFDLTINNVKLLFTGDAGIESEKYILDNYELSNYDILKVGHHGSRTSSSKEFIDTISPDYALISVGQNNKFKHPHQETLDNLINSKIYRTDQNGSIMFTIKNNKLRIETCSP